MSPVAKAAHGEDAGRCNFLGHIPCQCAEDEEKKKVRAKLKKIERTNEDTVGNNSSAFNPERAHVAWSVANQLTN